MIVTQAQINELALKQAEERAAVCKAAQFLYGMPEGELVFGYLLKECGVLARPPQDFNPNAALYREALLDVGTLIVNLIIADAGKFKANMLRSIASQPKGD